MRKLYGNSHRLHHGSQKRFYGSDKIYFIVSKTFKNHPYFRESIFCDLFIEELKICLASPDLAKPDKQLKRFRLYGFCLVYDHLNLLIQPNEKYNISQVIKSLKENVSRDINYIIFNENNEGDTSTCRLQVRGSITKYQKQFIEKYSSHDYPKFKWQKSFHDHVIRNEKDFDNHYNYCVYNFVKHNLSENWHYTSLNYEDLIDEINF